VDSANVASAFFALAAAALWFLAALVKTPRIFTVQVISSHASQKHTEGTEIISEGTGTSDELTALGHAITRQSLLNACAAGCAAAAALCQGLAALLTYLIAS
jgi:hypothetical protein